MRTAAALLLFFLFFIALTSGPPAQVSTRPGAQVSNPGVHRPPPAPKTLRGFNERQALATSAQVLVDLVRPGFNPIPLAILNKTQCVIFINSRGAENAWGIASCRLTPNNWSGPAFVSYHADRVEASKYRELIVLLISSRAVQSLTNNQLKLGAERGSQPGLVLNARNANLQDTAIAADTFTYSRSGPRTLAPGSIHAVITADQEMTSGLYARRINTATVLTGRTPTPKIAAGFVTAVGSFFNTITPAGIILHHSAIIPSTQRVPTNEQQVDLFHQQRGFAVACFGRIYHVAYHYFILPNGKVNRGRPDNCQGAHAHGYNAYLGISLAGDFSSVDNPAGKKGPTRPTPAQLKALHVLCKRLMQKYRIPPQHVLRHSDVANTRCPGDRFPFDLVVKQLRAP